MLWKQYVLSEIKMTFCWISYFDDRLDVYIYDYLMKRKLHGSAKAFQAEAKVSTDPVGKSIVNRWHSTVTRFLCVFLLHVCVTYLFLSHLLQNFCQIQLLMLLVVSYSSGGPYSGIYSLLGQMRSIQKLLRPTLRFADCWSLLWITPLVKLLYARLVSVGCMPDGFCDADNLHFPTPHLDEIP